MGGKLREKPLYVTKNKEDIKCEFSKKQMKFIDNKNVITVPCKTLNFGKR